MSKSDSRIVRVAVTGGGALLGQGIIRALQQSAFDVHIAAVDVSPFSAGLFWTSQAYLVPKASASNYIDAIHRLLVKEQPDILLVGTDVELAPLAEARETLEQETGTRILVSSPNVVAIADDKFATACFFRRHGFAAPASATGSDLAGIAKLVDTYGFPLIVKPRTGARSYGVVLVRDAQELRAALERTPHAVVQEYIGTEHGDEFTASGLYFDDRCNAAIVMRRDLRDGNTYRAFTVIDTFLETKVREWTEALRPYGPANFQFRIDRDGKPRVFEINARFSGTTPLRAHAGFNEVEMCIRRILWDEPVVQPSIKPVSVLRHWTETVIEPHLIQSIGPI